jgi:CRP/FNR family transcriptional regulator, anaerobic regulatory protein
MGLPCMACPVRDRAACSVLTVDERRRQASAGRIRRLRRGELLFAAGDESLAFATLITGALKVAAFDEAGTEAILALVRPGSSIGELFAPFARHDVIALSDSELCVFPKSEMARAVELYPRLALALLRRSQEDLLQSRDLLALSRRRSASARVAGFLLGLAGDPLRLSPGEFELPMTRGEIAAMLGLSIETVSRALTGFERGGAIRRKGARGIGLLDPARLTQSASGSSLRA